MTDGAASTVVGTDADTNSAGGLGRIGDAGCDDLGSCSSVMRVRGTMLFFLLFVSSGSIVSGERSRFG